MPCRSRFPVDPCSVRFLSAEERQLPLILYSKTDFLYDQIVAGHNRPDQRGNMKTIDVITGALVIIGALNWGLAGVFHLDLVAMVFGMNFGETSALSSVVYALVGVSGLYQALTWKSNERRRETAPATSRA
jgi:hypothetical protein